MIIVPGQFLSCNAEALKMDFKKHKINPKSFNWSALFTAPRRLSFHYILNGLLALLKMHVLCMRYNSR